jgi:hypothetical protein
MAECLVICPADTGHLVLVMAPFRRDRVDADGKLTLRHKSRLHHIGIGCRWSGTNVLILARDLDIRIITQNPTWLTIKDFRLARLSDLRVPGSRRANLRTKPGP